MDKKGHRLIESVLSDIGEKNNPLYVYPRPVEDENERFLSVVAQNKNASGPDPEFLFNALNRARLMYREGRELPQDGRPALKYMEISFDEDGRKSFTFEDVNCDDNNEEGRELASSVWS
jgi:hypothetical protein